MLRNKKCNDLGVGVMMQISSNLIHFIGARICKALISYGVIHVPNVEMKARKKSHKIWNNHLSILFKKVVSLASYLFSSSIYVGHDWLLLLFKH